VEGSWVIYLPPFPLIKTTPNALQELTNILVALISIRKEGEPYLSLNAVSVSRGFVLPPRRV